MNVIFLDYDGVVNTPMWSWNNKVTSWICSYSHPNDNTVNNFQAVQWVSEFCENYDYSIVVTSFWRQRKNYQDCLKNGGLRSNINILGATPVSMKYITRGEEISAWLDDHPEVEKYLIFDDEDDMDEHMKHLIKCNDILGFGYNEYELAVKAHKSGVAARKIDNKEQ